MEDQLVVITNNESQINDLISNGWRVQSVTAQPVSTGSTYHLYGKFCFVLTKSSII